MEGPLGLFDWEAVSSECWVRSEKAFTLAERLGLDDKVRSLVMYRFDELKQLLESNREGADRFIESQQFPLNLSCEKKTICNILFGNWLWQQPRSSYCTLSMLLVL